ncbi:MAG: 1-phosphofructokinase [Micromonosporaceae bacterium]
MIVTVTLNPSLDRTIEIPSLDRGQVLRAGHAHVEPGGKGVNVSRALLANGVDSLAVLPCGGDEGPQLVRLLRTEGVPLRTVPIGGHTRSNVTLVEPDGTVTKINEPGPVLTDQEFDAVITLLLDAARAAEWVVVCGSLPPGVPPEAFSELCGRLVATGVSVAVDTSGEGLRDAALAGVALVKPNREELAEVVGAALPTYPDVVAAARQLHAWGAGAVLASLGADGAVLVDGDGVVSGDSPVVRPRSTVGAGDALLAGFLAASTRGADPRGASKRGASTRGDVAGGADALAEALSWGAAAVSLPGSRMPGPDDLRQHQAHIHPLLAQG